MDFEKIKVFMILKKFEEFQVRTAKYKILIVHFNWLCHEKYCLKRILT